MKPTHLKTLSARIDELEHLLVKGKINGYEFINYLLEDKDRLKQPVTLAHFVPCDKNGVPLEKPKRTDRRDWDYQDEQDKLEEAYNEAQKSVIFEGWEVVRFDGEYLYIVNKESDIELEFNIQDGVVEVNLNQSTLCNLYGNVTTYADLAEATTENPLKLK